MAPLFGIAPRITKNMYQLSAKGCGRVQGDTLHQRMGRLLLLVSSGLLASISMAAFGQDLPGAVLASDDFRHGSEAWRIEQQSPDSRVQAQNGILDLQAPSGLTLWYRQPFSGSYEIQFTAIPVKASFPGYPDRVSDLNLFWNATTASGGDPGARKADGTLNTYDDLRLYYLGFGANGNRTTRLRRYDGTAARPQVAGYAEPELATSDDRLGPLPDFAKLKDGEAVHIRVQSISSPQGATQLRVLANEHPVFAWSDPNPYRQGWLALRTTTSHLRISDFRVIRL